MGTLKRLFALLWLAMCFSGAALALDLKQAKFPIEYECRMTHSGGISIDKRGNWHSGAFEPDGSVDRYILERFHGVQHPVRKGACESSKLGMRHHAGEGFCLTILPKWLDEKKLSFSKFCAISFEHLKNGQNSMLVCENGDVFDSDRLVLLRSSGLVLFEYSDMPQASVSKSDCKRLDR